MVIIEILLLIALITLGINASVTDIRDGRIYNKVLIKFALAAIILDIAIMDILPGSFVLVLYNYLNFGINCFVLVYVLFYTHSIAGGDCKLLLVMSLLYPANYYLVYERSDVTLYFVICLAVLFGYLYFLGYSIYELIKKRAKITGQYIKKYIMSFLKSFVSASGYICLINLAFYYYGDTWNSD